MTIKAGIVGFGSYAPERIVTNDELSTIMDTSDEWITERTGIKERRWAAPEEYTSTMAVKAIRNACAMADLPISDIEYILLATATPDMRFPNTAAWASNELGLRGNAALDVSTACAGFLYSLEIAKGLVASGIYKNVVAVGAEKLTSILDLEDRATAVLFGDGAGAAVVAPVADDGSNGHEIVASRSFCDFNWEALYLKGPGARFPMTNKSFEEKHCMIRMNGREVYRFVVSECVDMMKHAMKEAGITADDIALFIPHQANANMLEFAANKAGIPKERMFLNIHKYGNTSSASVPLAMVEANQQGLLKKGDLVFMIAFGGGLSSSYTLLRW